jgi:glycosyltransferase involved in cell wall biosynthesis
MFWGRLAAHLVGVPVIAAALHSTGWPDGIGRLNRMLNRWTDTFIAVADAHAEFLRGFERIPADRVRVIRNGVDCQRFQPQPTARVEVRRELGLADDTPLVGIVAALREEKNHGLFVRAAAVVGKSFPQVHWLIVGDGPRRAGIERLAGQLGVADRIHLLGTRHDTERIVSALDLFTLCSLNEASPVSILEALACGVPVVATDVGSVSESVRAGQTGLLVPSQDLQAMSRAIETLLANPELRASMGTAGRQLVHRTGSLDSMVHGYQRMISELYDARVAATALRPRARLAGCDR